MKITRTLLYPLLVIALLSTGCALFVVGAAAGGGVAVWQYGKLEDTLNSPIGKVYAAFGEGLKQMKVQVTESKADNLVGEIKGNLANGENFWINLHALTGASTKVTIRVGVLGNKDFSTKLLDSARARL